MKIWEYANHPGHLRRCPECLSKYHCKVDCPATQKILAGWYPSVKEFKEVNRLRRYEHMTAKYASSTQIAPPKLNRLQFASMA